MSYTGTPLLGETQHRGTEPPSEAKRVAAALRNARDNDEDADLGNEEDRESQPAGPASSPELPSGTAAVAAVAASSSQTLLQIENVYTAAPHPSSDAHTQNMVDTCSDSSQTDRISLGSLHPSSPPLSSAGGMQHVVGACSDMGGALASMGLGTPYPSPAFFARNLDVLPSGQVPTLCLWAIELRIQHPITDVELHLLLPDPPEFHDLLARNGGVCVSD